jgi:hypothetical protein
VRRGALAVGLVTCSLVLSGCGAAEPDPYPSATAAELQQAVLHVTRAANEQEHEAALVRLEELAVATKVAHARGELTEAREDSILSALALVRTDLERLIAEAEAKRKAAAERRAAEEEAARKTAAEEEAARKAAAEEKAAREAATEEQAQEDARRRAEQEAERPEQEAEHSRGGPPGHERDKGDKGNGKKGQSGKGKGAGSGKGPGRNG